MRTKQYRVELTDAERDELVLLVSRGAAPARVIRRAHILLRASEGAEDAATAAALHTSASTVARTRERFARAPAAGDRLRRALYERPRPGAERRLGPKEEAHLVALACSDAPEGRTYWTMQLLADRLVELRVVAEISDETVRRVLKKTT